MINLHINLIRNEYNRGSMISNKKIVKSQLSTSKAELDKTKNKIKLVNESNFTSPLDNLSIADEDVEKITEQMIIYSSPTQ